MIERLQCTVLADNYVAAPGLLAEHGLSILVEADDRRILFDTGQGLAPRHNVRALGLSLSPLDAIVLSHGHYDHTGGLAFAIEEGRPRSLFAHPAAVNAKFARRHPSGARSIGMPRESSAALKYVQQVVWTPSPTEVVPGIMCTGEIPRSFGPRADDGMFYLDEDCHEPDPLIDDQALFITTKKVRLQSVRREQRQCLDRRPASGPSDSQ